MTQKKLSMAELQRQLAQMQNLLAAHGILPPEGSPIVRPEDRADYIEFGSPEHAAFLGLVEVGKDEDAEDFITFTGKTGKTFRLEDQVTPFMHYPDPNQVATLVLRQKVSVFESGKPEVPDDAKGLWTPEPMPGETWEQTTQQVVPNV